MGSIIAPASGTQRAGVIVIRASGPNVTALYNALCRAPLPEPRYAALRKVYDTSGEIIDNSLVLYFNAPHSFTGEDVLELQIHGGPSVLAAVMKSALETGLVRYAEPGEFSKRAFRNGRMDLTQAEGLADLIDAETEAQRKQAFRQMEGGLRQAANSWREAIIDCLAEAEAYIDFPDEDLPLGLSESNRRRIIALRETLTSHIEHSKNFQKIRDGLHIVIIGAPNVGKSSLLNVISGRDAAIVSSIAGTTRDVVEVSMVFKGNLISLADTAGLRDASDLIEQEGIKRALNRCENADLILGLASDEKEANSLAPHLRDGDVLIWSKCDILSPRHFDTDKNISQISLSAHSGVGVDALLDIISKKCVEFSQSTEIAPLTRVRHIAAIESAILSLENCLRLNDDVPELACEELRLATRALGELVGVVDIDHIYDKIFSSFCIGK